MTHASVLDLLDLAQVPFVVSQAVMQAVRDVVLSEGIINMTGTGEANSRVIVLVFGAETHVEKKDVWDHLKKLPCPAEGHVGHSLAAHVGHVELREPPAKGH